MIMKIAKMLCLSVVIGLAVFLIGCGGGEDPERGDGGGHGGGTGGKVAVVNGKCPLMGNKITQTAMSPDMVREFEGQKVGFCCPPCGPKWDALSDDEKKTKLAAVIGP